MRRLLTDDEWYADLMSFEHSAFRLELQREYREPSEEATVKRFLSGDPQSPEELDDFLEWYDEVAQRVADGRRMGRVRVHDDPPTPYQQWLRWLDPWNRKAGEDIRYISRRRAHQVGLLPTAGDDDWWLIDSSRLLVMRFDSDGRRTGNELVTDPLTVLQACQWRDLALHYSAPLEAG